MTTISDLEEIDHRIKEIYVQQNDPHPSDPGHLHRWLYGGANQPPESEESFPPSDEEVRAKFGEDYL